MAHRLLHSGKAYRSDFTMEGPSSLSRHPFVEVAPDSALWPKEGENAAYERWSQGAAAVYGSSLPNLLHFAIPCTAGHKIRHCRIHLSKQGASITTSCGQGQPAKKILGVATETFHQRIASWHCPGSPSDVYNASRPAQPASISPLSTQSPILN